MHDMDKKAGRATPKGENRLPHLLETFDFVAMYNNIPVTCLKRVMNELLEMVFTYQQICYGWKSLYIRYGYKKDDVTLKIEEVHWSDKAPVDATGQANFKEEFYVGTAKLCEWINFVLNEGYVQFGSNIYKQSSGIFMGMSPAPDLANDFAFMHEFNFLKVMIDEFEHAKSNGNEPLYPFAFIEQYGSNTKRFIDDIVTVSLGSHNGGPTFEQIIKKEGNIYGGMYPLYVKDVNGEEIDNPISIIKEQTGDTVHFLDMEILQSIPGVSQIKMYDKRDHMETLENYRRYPHVETRLLTSCKYATLHCQLCRFSIRCSEIKFFQTAAAKLMKDMIKNKYNREKLRNKLHNFKNSFFEKSPIAGTIRDVKNPSVRDKYWRTVEMEVWNHINHGE